MATQTKKPAARKMRTGYGLHADRLSFSHKPAIRSVKFPLIVADEKVRNEFCENVKSDYRNCVGDLNLSDWHERKEKPTYSVFDFWLDSLRAGVRFFWKTDSVHEFLLKEVAGIDLPKRFSNYFSKLEKDKYIDLEKTYRFYSTEKRGGEGFDKVYNSIVRKEHWVKKGDEHKRPPEVVAMVNEIIKTDIFRKDEKWKGTDIPHIDYAWTFLVVPNFPFLKDAKREDLPRLLLEDRIKHFPSKKAGESSEELTEALGLLNDSGAFSNYFNSKGPLELLRRSPEEVAQKICRIFPKWKSREAELHERVKFLSVCAQRLYAYPLKRGVSLVGHWGEYRTFFGGKIDSWVTNYLRQKMDITGKGKINKKTKEPEKGEITFHQEDIEKALAKVWIADKPALTQMLKNLCVVLGEVYHQGNDEISNSALEVYRNELAEARSALNRAYQEQFPNTVTDEADTENNQKKDQRANKDLPHLFRDIKQLPEFVGDAKKRRFEQFLEAPQILRLCLEKLSAFEKARLAWKSRTFKIDDIEFAKRTLERLRAKHYGRGYGKGKRGKPWHDSGFSGTRFRDLVGAFFARLKLTDALKQPRPLFKSRFARSKEPIFAQNAILNRLNEKQGGELLTAFVSECAPRWYDIRNKYDLTDALWLEKIRIGVALALAGKDSFSLADVGGVSKEERSILNELDIFMSLLKKEAFTRDEFGRILQGYILAPAVGAVMQLSREEYMERYCVLPINTEQHYPLCYRLANKGGKEWGILLDRGAIKKSRVEKGDVELFLKKKDIKDFANEKQYELIRLSDATHFARLHTSLYEMQFINKALRGKESWYSRKNLATDLSSYSLIVEEPVKLGWDIANGTVSLKRTGERQLIVSIPFNLRAAGTIDALAMGRAVRKRRIMGIDVGEYGVAYVILDYDRSNGSVSGMRARGFIEEPLIHTIREFIGTLKNRQARGTFGMPSTKLARIRENAITSLRNQIHDIALRYNAEPVYEFSISNFETGSGKVSKIYKSVKTADVGGDTDADKAQVSLVWGNRARWFGTHVGSYATSYICMKCGYSPYEAHEGDSEAKKKALKKEKDEARPSLEQFLKMPEAEDFDRLRLKEFAKRRGNSGIYVCPNPNPKCRFVTDADIQAAYWIGLKKIWKEKNNANLVAIQQLVDFHNSIKTKPIPLLTS